MGHSAVDRPCTGHIRDDPLDSSGHACQGACILVEHPDDGTEALGFSSSSLASSARTDHDHVERRNTRCTTEESPSTASFGHQVLAGEQYSYASADCGDGLEDGTAPVTFFYKLPRDRMQLALSNEGTNRPTTWARQMEKARDCTAILDQLMLILAGTVQLHEHVSALADLGGVQAHVHPQRGSRRLRSLRSRQRRTRPRRRVQRRSDAPHPLVSATLRSLGRVSRIRPKHTVCVIVWSPARSVPIFVARRDAVGIIAPCLTLTSPGTVPTV